MELKNCMIFLVTFSSFNNKVCQSLFHQSFWSSRSTVLKFKYSINYFFCSMQKCLELTGGIEWLSRGALRPLLLRAFHGQTDRYRQPIRNIHSNTSKSYRVYTSQSSRRNCWEGCFLVCFGQIPQELGPFPAMTFVEYKSRSSNQWILAKALWEYGNHRSSMTFLPGFP